MKLRVTYADTPDEEWIVEFTGQTAHPAVSPPPGRNVDLQRIKTFLADLNDFLAQHPTT